MSKKTVLSVTGSCGLIGSEVSAHFARRGFHAFGIDSDHRAIFFRPEADDLYLEPWRAKAFPVIKDPVVDRSAFDRMNRDFLRANLAGRVGVEAD
jgi:nucleoside-diphosphate-sugar epimerase